jgi:hypothetical protein
VPELVPVPPGVVTVMRPVVAPVGTRALIRVLDGTLNDALTPLNLTDVAPVKFAPAIATDEPTRPETGVNDEMIGAFAVLAVTVKLDELVAVPPAVVTLIGPVDAPAATAAVIDVADLTVKLAAVPLNLTDVAPARLVPLIVTDVPTVPLAGENDVTVGACATTVTLKLDALVAVPPGVVTPIGPVDAPAGTAATIDVGEVTLKLLELVPLKLTAVAPVKFAPVRVTEVPTGPLAGANDVIVGACVWTVTLKLDEVVAVPPPVVTVIGPVEAPVGTVAVIDVADATAKVAATPLKLTAVAPVKFVPVTVTEVPAGPLDGANDVIVGAAGCVEPPHDGNRNEPMRVSQLSPVIDVGCAFVYSIVYQKVQPSGSIDIAL